MIQHGVHQSDTSSNSCRKFTNHFESFIKSTQKVIYSKINVKFTWILSDCENFPPHPRVQGLGVPSLQVWGQTVWSLQVWGQTVPSLLPAYWTLNCKAQELMLATLLCSVLKNWNIIVRFFCFSMCFPKPNQMVKDKNLCQVTL